MKKLLDYLKSLYNNKIVPWFKNVFIPWFKTVVLPWLKNAVLPWAKKNWLDIANYFIIFFVYILISGKEGLGFAQFLLKIWLVVLTGYYVFFKFFDIK